MNRVELLKKLSALSGISGEEALVREAIIEEIKGHCDYRVDALGNLIAFKKGKAVPTKKLMLCAHMDEVGFLVNTVCEDGTLRFLTVGGVDDRVVIGRSVLVGAEKIPGVIGTKAIHHQTTEERGTVVKTDKLFIDIGCENKEEAEKLVIPGDPVYFVGEFFTFGNGMLQGKAIDDRFGCGVLVELIQSELSYDTHFVFSVQEEIGSRGAGAAANQINPDRAIIIEATSANDLPEVKEPLTTCKLGSGAVVGFFDRGTLYPTDMVRQCFTVGERLGIPVQWKTMPGGSTDAAAIHKSGIGCKSVTISAPCRYIHTPYCVIKEQDMDAVTKLAAAMLEALGQEEAYRQ